MIAFFILDITDFFIVK